MQSFMISEEMLRSKSIKYYKLVCLYSQKLSFFINFAGCIFGLAKVQNVARPQCAISVLFFEMCF